MGAGHTHPHPHTAASGGRAKAQDPPEFEVDVCEEGAGARRLEVRVARKSVDRAFDNLYADLARNARVRGFRPGKAPRRVLERLYGGALGEDIERLLVDGTLSLALERAGVEAIAPPDIDADPPRAGADFAYAARVEVRPPIELPELEGLPGTRPSSLIGDEEVQRELEALQQRHAVTIEEPEGVAAAVGHILTVDYVGRIDGQPFEGGTGRDVDLELGSGRFVPGFEEQLVGASAEEDREVRVTFPEDYDPSVAGKDAVFAVHVAAVKRRDVPDLDDDFARDLGEFDTLDALRERIESDLRRDAESRAERALRQSVAGALAERCDFEVPPGAIDYQLERRLRMAAQDLLRSGMPEEVLSGQIDAWRREWRPAAEQELREQWVLEAVAEAREVAVDEAEVEERVAELAAARGLSVSDLRDELDAQALESSIRADLRRDKALDFIVSTAKVEDASGI